MIKSCGDILLDADIFDLDSKGKQELIDSLDTYIKKSKQSPPKAFKELNENTKTIIERLRDDYRLQQEMKYHDELNHIIIKKELVDTAMSSPTKNPMKWLLNKLEGGWGQRLSIDYEGKSSGGRLTTMFLHDLERSDLLDVFRNGKIQDDIFNDLHLVYKDKSGMYSDKEKKLWKWSKNEQAKEIADIIHFHDEVSVSRLNMSNARIRMSADRLYNKVPDQQKIRKLGKTQDEAFVAWKKLAYDHFALDEMFELIHHKDYDKYLREIFIDYWNGVHIQSQAGDDINIKFLNTSNLGRKVSKRNRIVYKSGANANAYLNEVGYKGYNLQHAITFGLEHDGRNHALLNNLGTNPQAMLRGVVESIEARMKAEGYDKFNKFSRDMVEEGTRGTDIPKKLMDSLEILNGTTRSPLNVRMAAISGSVRAFKNMALLGFATIRSANDMLTMAWSAKKNGIPYGTIIREAPINFIKGFELPWLGIKADKQQKRIAALIGLGPRALVADVVGKFGADDSLPGLITKLQRNYFKLNLLTYWNDAMKTSFSMMLSHHLGLEASKSWNKSSKDIQKLLSDFEITPAQWEVIRHAAAWKAEDGRVYMSPDRLDNPGKLTDDDIKSLIRIERGPREHLEQIASYIKEDSVDSKIDFYETRIEELKEKIARLKTKKSKREVREREAYKGAQQAHQSTLDLIKNVKEKNITEDDISRWTADYMENVEKREAFNVETSKMLQKHYQTKDNARIAMKSYMEGMDIKSREDFERTFTRFWDKRRKTWDVKKLREFMISTDARVSFRESNPTIVSNDWVSQQPYGLHPRKNLTKAQQQELPPLSRTAELAEKFHSDPQQAFGFIKEMGEKEIDDAWGKFLKIMSEDEEHMWFIHEKIQKSWKEEGQFLFTGHVEKSARGDYIGWRPPAIYKHMLSEEQTGVKVGKGLWKKADEIEQSTKLMREKLPIWIDDYIKSYVSQEIKQVDIQSKRTELSNKLTTLFYDRNDHAVLIPGAKEKRIMTQGQRAGTPLGEAIRFIGQFKTFPVTVITKSLMQEIDGKPLAQIRSNEIAQLAKFIVGMTMMGAITTVASDFLKNKTTRETWDPTSPEFLNFVSGPGARNLADAFLYGGGAGFYGDIIGQPFGNSQHFSKMISLLGPTFSQYDDIIDVTSGVLKGDAKAKKLYSILLQNMPMQNLFYAKTAFDYLLNYQMQDIIDPGYHSRQYSRMQKETLQQYRNTPTGIFQ